MCGDGLWGEGFSAASVWVTGLCGVCLRVGRLCEPGLFVAA